MSKQHYDPHPHPPNPEYNHLYNPPSNHLASSDKAGSSQEQHSSSTNANTNTNDVNTNTNMNLIDEGGEFDSDSESLWDELNIAKTHEIQQHRNRTSNNNNTVTSANTANIGTATSSGTVTHDDQLQVHHRAHGHLSSGNQNQNHTNNYYVSHAGHLRPNHQQYEHQHGHGRQTVQEEVSNFITQTASNVSNLASLGMNKVSYAYHHYQQPKPLFPHHTIIDPTATTASATSATTAIGHRNRRGTRIETNHSHQGYHYQQSGNYISPFQDFGLETSNTGTSALHHETSTRTFTSTSTSTSTSIPPNTTARSTGTRTGTDTGTAHHYTQIQNNHYYEESSNTNPLLPKNEHGHESFVEIDEDRDVQGGNKKFILLNQFRLTPKRDGWGAVANLDLFFTSMYNYYYHRGIVPILGKGVVELISLFFTLWLSVFLFAYLDWKLLFSCTDKNSCLDSLSDYIIDKPFEEASIYNFLIILYIILFSVYGIVSLASFYSTIRDALEAKYIYEDKLGISSRKLEGGVIEWHEIIHKILMLQQSGEYRIAIHSTDIKDELIIAQRILRRENFMIAFFNRGLLDLTIPLPSSSSLLLSLLCWGRWRTTTTTSLEGRRSKTMFYSKSMEWSIYFCVLSYMFNHKYQIRPAFCMDPLALQRRFVVCGIAHTIFMPFLLLFMTLHFFMQNVYDFRSTKQYLGPREWSNVAKWTFRELNELPHVFERRISPSYQAADKYLQLFVASSIFNSIGRILVFLSGSLGAVCLALAAVNDAILLHVKLGHWNLLWYVGILGATYTVGKGMLPPTETEMTSAVKNKKSSHRNVFAEMDAALVEVTSHTHHYPEFWRKRGWDDIIKNSLLELYQYKVQLFMLEVVSVIVAPIVLCFSLPRCAIRICSFVNRIKIEVPGTGDHCGFATFDFDMFEDENWEGQQINNANGTTTTTSDNDRVGISAQLNLPSERPKAKGGKMEKSFFNFKTVHPDWKCSSSGQDLIDRMETYQAEQALALARERQHHIAAAARQLETLRLLEETSSNGDNDVVVLNYKDQIVEDYVGLDTSETVERYPMTGNPSIRKNDNINVNRVHFENYPKAANVPHSMISSDLQSTNINRPNQNNPVAAAAAASVMHYADVGLSTELQRVLNRSTLDPGTSLLGLGELDKSLALSLLYKLDSGADIQAGDSIYEENSREEQLQKKYMMLEQYHSQMKSIHNEASLNASTSASKMGWNKNDDENIR